MKKKTKKKATRNVNSKRINSEPNILEIIKDHHDLMRECMSVVKDERASASDKKQNLFSFIETLKIHAKSEEETLYDSSENVKALQSQTIEARTEHQVAEFLMRELDSLSYREQWNDEIEGKAKVLTEMVQRHMEEEEEEFFSAIKKEFSDEELKSLGVEYEAKFEERIADLEEDHGILSAGQLTNSLIATLKGAAHKVSQAMNKLNANR